MVFHILHLRANTNLHRQEIVADLRRFLNMINNYRQFITHPAESQGLMQKLIPGNKKNDHSKIAWTEEGNAAFKLCKEDVILITYLTHPQPEADIN